MKWTEQERRCTPVEILRSSVALGDNSTEVSTRNAMMYVPTEDRREEVPQDAEAKKYCDSMVSMVIKITR